MFWMCTQNTGAIVSRDRIWTLPAFSQWNMWQSVARNKQQVKLWFMVKQVPAYQYAKKKLHLHNVPWKLIRSSINRRSACSTLRQFLITWTINNSPQGLSVLLKSSSGQNFRGWLYNALYSFSNQSFEVNYKVLWLLWIDRGIHLLNVKRIIF